MDLILFLSAFGLTIFSSFSSKNKGNTEETFTTTTKDIKTRVFDDDDARKKNDNKQKLNPKHSATWTSIHTNVLNDCIKNFPQKDLKFDPYIEYKIIKSWRDCFNCKSSIPDDLLKQKIQEILNGIISENPEINFEASENHKVDLVLEASSTIKKNNKKSRKNFKNHKVKNKIKVENTTKHVNVSKEPIEASDENGELKVLDEYKIPQRQGPKFECTMCNFSSYQAVEFCKHKNIHKVTNQIKLENSEIHEEDVSKQCAEKVLAQKNPMKTT